MKKMTYRAVVALCMAMCSIFSTSHAEVEVRKITPPKFEASYLGKKILCHRPMRHGSPAMFLERKEGKTLVHNYGHGGSGFTLGPGTAGYVVGLLQAEIGSDKKDQPVAVVGAGIIGLFTAYKLLEEGYKDVTVYSAAFDDLTSHNAGGLLAPVSMDNDPKMQKIVDKIGIDAYKFYAQVARKEHPHVKEGAIIVPTYFETREESGLEPYVGTVMQPAKDVILDFQNGTTRQMVAYDDGIFMDTCGLTVAMKKVVEKLGAKLVKKEVSSFAELPQNIIFNCTGLGAKKLVGDNAMVSVQGHLIMLKNQNPEDLQHMILVYFKEDKTKTGFKIKRSMYMFPKRLAGAEVRDVGVLGGTFIEGADKSTPHEEEFEIMLKGAKKFYGLAQ